MIMTHTAIAAEQAKPPKQQGNGPDLSLNEIAELLRGKSPVSNAPSCLDQIPFLPVRSKTSGN